MRNPTHVTLKQLRALSEVSEAGNIAAAAEQIGLTGPAVHSQLRLLESEMGTTLLHREGRERNRPTAEGETLVRAYARIRTILDRAMAEIEDLRRGHAGTVVMGVVSTGKYFAPRIVAELRRAMPELSVVLRVANRQDTIAALSRGEFDLCIMGRPPREPLVEATSLTDHPHVVIAPPDHPLAAVEEIETSALAEALFILREEGSGTRILAERFLDEIDADRPNETVVMDSNETIKQAVMSGLGLALISRYTVAREIADGHLDVLAVRGTPVMRTWFLLRVAEDPFSPAAKRVSDWLLSNPDRIRAALEAQPRCPPGQD